LVIQFQNTVPFADDQAIFSESEDHKRAKSRVENLVNGFNMRFSTTKTKMMAFQGNKPQRMQINSREQNDRTGIKF
jgi:hypothetical protein